MYAFKKSSAFTLVELIVVITILAILGTIGFMSFLGFQTQARDSARLSDINVISKGVEFYKLKSGFYPTPSDAINISFSGSLAWQQGSFGESAQIQTERVSQVPLDPLTKNPYTYATTYNKQEFEVASIYEGAVSYDGDIRTPISQSYAQESFFTKVIGNYNKKIITLYNNTNLVILGVPTLITSEIANVDIIDLYTRNSFAPNGGKNIPGSYAGVSIGNEALTLVQDDGFIPGTLSGTTAPVLYDGTIDELSQPIGKVSFAENLVSYYKSSNISGQYIDVTSQETEPIKIVNDLLSGEVGGLSSKTIALSDPKSYTPAGPPTYPPSSGIFTTYWESQPLIVEQPSEINFSIESVGTVSIDWGDGIIENHGTGFVRHEYASLGNYEVKITGNLKRFYFAPGNAAMGLLEVRDWGNVQWSSMENMFTDAGNLTSIPLAPPDMSQTTSTAYMFQGTYQLNPPIGNWDVSHVTDMRSMFTAAEIFNQDLSSWDVSHVTDMRQMFATALEFNQDIGGWNVSSVQTMSHMFAYAQAFNQDLGGWNMSNVTDIQNMFLGDNIFNQDLSSWDVSHVENMGGIFAWNELFNQDISSWDVSSATNMISMFMGATSFNQDLSSWDVSNVTLYQDFDTDASAWVLPKPVFN